MSLLEFKFHENFSNCVVSYSWLDRHYNSPTPSAGPEHRQESLKENESTRSDNESTPNEPETTRENPPKSNLSPSDDEQPPERYRKILQDALCIRCVGLCKTIL